jgi:Flp pilus assembly protein TadG
LKLDHRDEGSRRANSGLRQRHPQTERNPESGQAMVEFALILFPLLILVAGIIQFGIGLNYWLDMNRIANQGARWAVVNEYPMSNGSTCVRTTTPAGSCAQTLQAYLKQQALTNGLNKSLCVAISFPDGGTTAGNPVKVQLTAPFKFVPILGIGTIDLKANATMRLEWTATQYASNTCP